MNEKTTPNLPERENPFEELGYSQLPDPEDRGKVAKALGRAGPWTVKEVLREKGVPVKDAPGGPQSTPQPRLSQEYVVAENDRAWQEMLDQPAEAEVDPEAEDSAQTELFDREQYRPDQPYHL